MIHARRTSDRANQSCMGEGGAGLTLWIVVNGPKETPVGGLL
jgi:hypothetical protein